MTSEFSAATRTADLKAMAEEPLDVLVIGGGIVGSWIALAAALRGYRTGLVEKGDFASGTSGKTSRLIHGGLRYLQQFRIGLVKQAARERDTLLRLAPSLVRPITFLIPVYRQRGAKRWQLRIGLWLYDALSKDKVLPRRRWLSPEGALALDPGLARDGLVAAVTYTDAMAHDARLVLAVVRAAHEEGALVANYARVLEVVRDRGRVAGARLQDEETGTTRDLRATVVVNATGVWAPDLQSAGARLRLRPTKGAHVLVPTDRVGLRRGIVLTGPDGRLMFAIPWGHFSLIGTTDTDYRGERDTVVPEAADVDYLLAAVNAAFPSARLSAADVVSAYAGLRPLVDTGEGEESDISRSHEVLLDVDGLVTVAGGKLTTARAMGEEVLDRVASRLPPKGTGPRDTLSARIEDPGASDPSNVLAAIPRIAREEMPVHLDDVMVRRTRAFHEAEDHGLDLAPEVANALAAELGWDASRRAAELGRYRQIVEAHRRWRGEHHG